VEWIWVCSNLASSGEPPLLRKTTLTTEKAGHDHAQAVSVESVIQEAGDRASLFRANGRPRRHGPARPLDRDAAAGEEST